MKHRDNAHEFALYVSHLQDLSAMQGALLTLHDEAVVHRISRVLRLNNDDKVILFDRTMHLFGYITELHKHSVTVHVDAIAQNTVLKPYISLWLPMLKREAFEQAVYSAVELGASEIQIIHTAKVQRHFKEHDLERIEHIMIAAAEQSKQFALPIIKGIADLADVKIEGKGIFCDPSGEPLLDVMQNVHFTKPERITVIVGPEGDLTEAEKFHLQQSGVHFMRLTPTVLRAQQAIAVALGAVRSVCVTA